jgi:RimJ/RimL family protein N-acetyltransferase
MYLSKIARVEGPNLVLRLIVPDDAAYVYGVRTNPIYSSHLSQVSGTFMDQREWILKYKAKEAKGEEFYYVIERKDGKRCGLVRIYDIEAESFKWGSWVLDENKTRKAALESAVLSFGIGFDALEKHSAIVNVRVANEHAAKFYRRLGMVETHRADQDIFFRYTREQFKAERTYYLKQMSEN